jgi:serine/threonine-protein kinase RsbT
MREEADETTREGERLTFRIRDEIDAADARREARRLAERHGFGAVRAYCLATVVSELAHNLVFHASDGGLIRIRARTEESAPAIEVEATDDGPGIRDLALAMQDGWSTAGSLGCGLPGTRRLTDEFEITSALGVGTRVTCAVRKQ